MKSVEYFYPFSGFYHQREQCSILNRVSYLVILCFTSTTINCIYLNSLARYWPWGTLTQYGHLNFTCLPPGHHGLFQDAFNLTYFRNQIHSAFTALDTGICSQGSTADSQGECCVLSVRSYMPGSNC